MALDFLFWPDELPTKALLDGYTPTIASNIIRADVDSGPARQRSRGNVVTETINFSYSMTESQVHSFREFSKIAGARSFWNVFPNPNDERYAGGKYRYMRFNGRQDVISDPVAEGGGEYTVNVSFDFWNMVPAKTREEIEAEQDG